jgi:hypothetical protein
MPAGPSGRIATDRLQRGDALGVAGCPSRYRISGPPASLAAMFTYRSVTTRAWTMSGRCLAKGTPVSVPRGLGQHDHFVGVKVPECCRSQRGWSRHARRW